MFQVQILSQLGPEQLGCVESGLSIQISPFQLFHQLQPFWQLFMFQVQILSQLGPEQLGCVGSGLLTIIQPVVFHVLLHRETSQEHVLQFIQLHG